MKTLDVDAWKLSIEQAEKDIKVQFKSVQNAVKKIISLEGIFSGKNADAIRLFYSTCHQPLLTYIDEMVIHYEETLRQMQDTIHSYESAPKGFVQQHFIEGDVTTEKVA